jgi:hypothetical protein
MRPSSSATIPLATTLRPPGNSQVTVAATRSGAWDQILHARLDPGPGAVFEHALEHLLSLSDARSARRVVAVDLDELNFVGVQSEQGVDVPLLVAALERVEVEFSSRSPVKSPADGDVALTLIRDETSLLLSVQCDRA